MIKLTETGEFYDTDRERGMGVTATKKRGRWQYRDTLRGALYASGMTPAAFVKSFWLRDDFSQ